MSFLSRDILVVQRMSFLSRDTYSCGTHRIEASRLQGQLNSEVRYSPVPFHWQKGHGKEHGKEHSKEHSKEYFKKEYFTKHNWQKGHGNEHSKDNWSDIMN